MSNTQMLWAVRIFFVNIALIILSLVGLYFTKTVFGAVLLFNVWVAFTLFLLFMAEITSPVKAVWFPNWEQIKGKEVV